MEQKSRGKIIAIIGAPASGKSTLAKMFGKKLKARVFLEGEEQHLPDYIKKNIAQNKNGLQTILYFHNKTVNQYLEALKLKEKGIVTILDTFWFSNIFYLDTMIKDKNERNLLIDLISVTGKLLSLPDVIIYIQAKNETIKQRITDRGRSFEKNFLKNAIQINRDHDKYLRMLNNAKLIKIKAEEIDINKILKSINKI